MKLKVEDTENGRIWTVEMSECESAMLCGEIVNLVADKIELPPTLMAEALARLKESDRLLKTEVCKFLSMLYKESARLGNTTSPKDLADFEKQLS